jgi:chromosomal replication initiator protein
MSVSRTQPMKMPPAETDVCVATPVDLLSRRLADRIGQHKHEMWFSRSARLSVHDATVDVAAQSRFVADWINSHFADDLLDVARELLGERASILVHIDPALSMLSHSIEAADFDRQECSGSNSSAARAVGRKGAAGAIGRSDAHGSDSAAVIPTFSASDALAGGEGERHARRNSHGIPRPMLRRLDSFVVGTCNKLAYSAARQLAEGGDAATISPLFLFGECGVGKTHLLQGICRRFCELNHRHDAMRYVTGEQFTNEYIAAVRSNTIDAFRRKMRKLELLAIDDVHFLANKVATQSEFLHTLDAIGLGGARIVMASDEHPRLIKRFSQALVSRFLSGMVVRVDPPARETRALLLVRLAEARGLRLNQAATDALAAKFIGSVRELEGAVTKLAAIKALTAPNTAEIGMVLVDQLLQDSTWQPRSPVRIATVIDVVCRRLSVQRVELTGSSRHRRVVLARSLVAHLGRELTTMSYPEIALAIGRNFHSTVHTAAQRLRGQLECGSQIDLGAGTFLPLGELIDQVKHEVYRATATA